MAGSHQEIGNGARLVNGNKDLKLAVPWSNSSSGQGIDPQGSTSWVVFSPKSGQVGKRHVFPELHASPSGKGCLWQRQGQPKAGQAVQAKEGVGNYAMPCVSKRRLPSPKWLRFSLGFSFKTTKQGYPRKRTARPQMHEYSFVMSALLKPREEHHKSKGW